MYENYLAHYGVKGMKWGVRRHRDIRRVNRIMKSNVQNNQTPNLDSVRREYQKEFKNKEYLQKARESNAMARRIAKEEVRVAKIGDRDDPRINKNLMSMIKKWDGINSSLSDFEMQIGKKYVDKFNDAQLRDIKYSGDINYGRQLLKNTKWNYKTMPDGYLARDYLRPWYRGFTSPDVNVGTRFMDSIGDIATDYE